MKLWQRVFLVALAFVMFAIQATQLFVLERSFDSAVKREYQLAASAHEALGASLSNHTAYQRLKTNKLLLSTTEIAVLLRDTVTADISTAAAIAVYRDGNGVTSAGNAIFDDISALPFSPEKTPGSGQSVIQRSGDAVYLMMVSVISLEMTPYVLYTAYDVTDVYETRDADIASARRTGLIFGTSIAVLLLILVRLFLRPLKTAVDTIGQIANGNYALTMPARGSDELKTLAESINFMSASIKEREEKLSEIAASRKRFADSMAHEMKTPLTSILGFADILRIKRTVTDAQRRDFATMIVDEAKHLRLLSAKLLQLASTDSTQLDLTDVPCAQLFSEVQNAMAPVLARRGMRLEVLCKQVTLHIDRALFHAMLYNLIDNAAKASPDGSTIWLAQSELSGHTVLSVIDEGRGMKPETVRRATEAFYMEDKARSRKAGGAGLGLSLCDDICRRHGARLEIRSVYMKGTTVMIHMNAMPLDAAQT